jgi:hypothetical protein
LYKYSTKCFLRARRSESFTSRAPSPTPSTVLVRRLAVRRLALAHRFAVRLVLALVLAHHFGLSPALATLRASLALPSFPGTRPALSWRLSEVTIARGRRSTRSSIRSEVHRRNARRARERARTH